MSNRLDREPPTATATDVDTAQTQALVKHRRISLLATQAALFAVITTLGLWDRLRERDEQSKEAGTGRDAGLTTLEVAVIALGLFLVAGVLVAVITNAVNSRTAQIN